MPLADPERIAAAQSYIDALSTHRADEVPFAPDCIRIEMGLKTGRSGDHLRRSLNNGPQFKLIERTTPPVFTVDGDTHPGAVRRADQTATARPAGVLTRRRDVPHSGR